MAYRALAIATCLALGCASIEPAPLPEGGAEAISAHQVRGDLAIAAEAWIDASAAKERLGTDFLRDGIVPVFVLIENRSPTRTVLIDPARVSLVAPESGARHGVADLGPAYAPLPSPAARKGAKAALVALTLVPGAALVTAPIWAPTAKEQFDDEVARFAIALLGLHASTLSPGEHARGVLLYPIEPKDRARPLSLRVEILDPSTQTTESLEVPLAMSLAP